MAAEPHERLGRAIRQLRVRHGLSQREAAVGTGMRSSQFARYERGDVPNPRLSTIVRIARGLGVTPAELLGRVG